MCLHPGEATRASQDENDVGNAVSWLKKGMWSFSPYSSVNGLQSAVKYFI